MQQFPRLLSCDIDVDSRATLFGLALECLDTM